MRKSHKYAFAVGWVLVGSIVNLAIGFFLRIILARWLGSFDLGLYTMVVTVQEFATLIAGIGISTALTKFVAQSQENRERISQLVYSAFVISITFGFVAGLVLFLISGTLANIFDMPQLSNLLKILAISLPFIVLFQAELGLVNGLKKMKSYATLIIIRAFSMIILVISLISIGLGIEGTVLGMILSIIGTALFGIFFSRKYLHLTYHNFYKNAKGLIAFGALVFATNTVNILLNQTGILMIGYFLDATKVGYYGVAVSMCMLFNIIPHAVQRVTFPLTAEYWYGANRNALQKMFDKSMKYTACIMFSLGLFFSFFAREITTNIFGADFINCVSPFLVLLAARVLRGSTINPIAPAFAARGRPDINLKVDALTLILNVFLSWFLIPKYGITGAATATTISLLIGTLVYLIAMPKMLNVRLDIRWYGLIVGLAATAIAIFLLGTRLINNYILGGVLLISFTFLVYGVLLTKEDKEFFRVLVFSLIKYRRKVPS